MDPYTMNTFKRIHFQEDGHSPTQRDVWHHLYVEPTLLANEVLDHLHLHLHLHLQYLLSLRGPPFQPISDQQTRNGIESSVL